MIVIDDNKMFVGIYKDLQANTIANVKLEKEIGKILVKKRTYSSSRYKGLTLYYFICKKKKEKDKESTIQAIEATTNLQSKVLK